MHSGELDRRITLMRATMTRNTMNEDVPSWGVFKKVWAKRRLARDGERIRAQQVGGIITARFIVRKPGLESLTVEDRLIDDGRTYEIRGVADLEEEDGKRLPRGHWLVITTSAELNGGAA